MNRHGAGHAAKGFTCWTQFVSMLFCQIGRANSLRQMCNGLACRPGRLVHLGIAKAPCRSTLSHATEHRPAALFEELFWTASARFRERQAPGGRKHKFRFKNKLLSLDPTNISLCLMLFPWAKLRRATGGMKAHVLLDHDDYLPAAVLLTEAQRSDVKLEFGATTVAAIYKERWGIELSFKTLKQNLTITTFADASENALRIQVWTAPIALLLLKSLHHLSAANWSLSNLTSMLRLNLFTYRELTTWLHAPMETPSLVPPSEQLTLALG